MDEKITREIINKRKAVRKKLAALQEGQIIHEEKYKPITQQLRTLAEEISKHNIKGEVKTEIPNKEETYKNQQESSIDNGEENIDEDENEITIKRPRAESSRMSARDFTRFASAIQDSDEEEEQFTDVDEEELESQENYSNMMRNIVDENSFMDYLHQFDSLPREYINNMIRDTSHTFDHVYGVRHDPDAEKFYIGDSLLDFEGPDIVVKNQRYKGTRGLYELLFKKDPQGYNSQEKDTYRTIVKQTNANRRNYNPQGQISGTKSWKYLHIIRAQRQLRPRTQMKKSGGEMMMDVTNKSTEFVYYDNPNEIIDRLKLLIASQSAGNTGHVNEINSIIEELREANIIV